MNSAIQGPNVNISSPLTLQFLCYKVLKVEKDLNSAEKKFDSKINDEDKIRNIMILSNNNSGADSSSQNHNFDAEIVNWDLNPEKLDVLDINTEDLKDLDDFYSIIDKLKDDDNFPNFENDIGHTVTELDNTHNNKQTINDKEFIPDSSFNLENERAKADLLKDIKPENGDNNTIILSSCDDSDLDLSLPDDIDAISLSSIEAYESSIQNNETSKVTIEIGRKIEYIINFTQATDTKATKEELCTISLSSSDISLKTDTETNEHFKEHLNDSLCSGYNSSDFEFITEDEAKADGFIINFNKTKELIKKDTNTTCEANANYINVPSTSNNSNVDYRMYHRIPEGENYFDLFSGIYTPTTPWMYENKSMGSLINPEYTGLGFDIGALSRQIREYQPDDEYHEEAEESTKKILRMYPRENRKRRRRFY